jgi:opacity protein-like surface antigen
LYIDYFWDRVLPYAGAGLECNASTFASWVAGITDMHHST